MNAAGQTEWLNAYDRLLHRATTGKVSSSVSLIIWWQGEYDTTPVVIPAATYLNNLYTLSNDLNDSYPDLDHFIIVQFRGDAVNKTTVTPPIQEAQRIASKNISGARIIASNGLQQHTDYLHYGYVNANETIGLQLAQMVGNALYSNLGIPAFNNYAPSPQPIKILRKLNKIIIKHKSGTNLMVQTGVGSNKFRLEGPNGSLTAPLLQSVAINNIGDIVLTYSGSLSNAVGLTYLSHSWSDAPEVREINGGRALLSFYKMLF